jgi:hypothetical protein
MFSSLAANFIAARKTISVGARCCFENRPVQPYREAGVKVRSTGPIAFLRPAMYSIKSPERSTLVDTGDRMPRYLSQHSLACLTRQGAEQLSKRLHAAAPVRTRRVLVNMQEGKMLVEFQAAGRDELEKWLAAEKFHFDWLLRIEWESADDGTLLPA